mgnify:CR=1 FL=1
MTTENRTVISKEVPLTEVFKKTASEKEALKKAKAEHKKFVRENARKA